MKTNSNSRSALWIAWGVAAVLAMAVVFLYLELDMTRGQVSSLETQNKITESALHDSENHREAERIINRAMLEAAKK